MVAICFITLTTAVLCLVLSCRHYMVFCQLIHRCIRCKTAAMFTESACLLPEHVFLFSSFSSSVFIYFLSDSLHPSPSLHLFIQSTIRQCGDDTSRRTLADQEAIMTVIFDPFKTKQFIWSSQQRAVNVADTCIWPGRGSTKTRGIHQAPLSANTFIAVWCRYMYSDVGTLRTGGWANLRSCA